MEKFLHELASMAAARQLPKPAPPKPKTPPPPDPDLLVGAQTARPAARMGIMENRDSGPRPLRVPLLMLSKERKEANFALQLSSLKRIAGQSLEQYVPQTFSSAPEKRVVDYGRRPRFGGRLLLSNCKYTSSDLEKCQKVHPKQVLEQITPKPPQPQPPPSRHKKAGGDFSSKFDDWMISLEKPGRQMRPGRVARGIPAGAKTARPAYHSEPYGPASSRQHHSESAQAKDVIPAETRAFQMKASSALTVSKTQRAVRIMEQYPIERREPKGSPGVDYSLFSQMQPGGAASGQAKQQSNNTDRAPPLDKWGFGGGGKLMNEGANPTDF